MTTGMRPAGAGMESSMTSALCVAVVASAAICFLGEVLQAALQRQRLPAHLQERAPLGHDVHREHLADAVVGGARAVGVGDPDTLAGLPVDGGDLAHLAGQAPGRVVGEAQEGRAGGDARASRVAVGVGHGGRGRGELRARTWEPVAAAAGAAPRRAGQLVGEPQQRALIDGVDVPELGAKARG